MIVAGGDNDTFAQAMEILKPGGIIGNVNYLGEGNTVGIPRLAWGCGMGHKQLRGGLIIGNLHQGHPSAQAARHPSGRLIMLQGLIQLVQSAVAVPQE